MLCSISQTDGLSRKILFMAETPTNNCQQMAIFGTNISQSPYNQPAKRSFLSRLLENSVISHRVVYFTFHSLFD